jgi:UDP-N-acetylmuramoyl-tripeptide--D-alanyl-D-alanine ligase
MNSTLKSPLSTAPSNTLWTSLEAIKATDGSCASEWFATGVSIDTRTLNAGDLFIAIKGDNSDGHNYVVEAIEKGAAAVVVDHIPAGVPAEKALVVVDTFKAMQDLGRAARARTGAKIIGITGSVGKTGTKEMLGVAYSQFGLTHWSDKSYNNHWGVPLSLSRMAAGSDFGVFEMGMNHPNEIAPLSSQVKPHIAIITTIAPVHIEHFSDGLEGIARAKSEIFSGMDEHGIAIINGDVEQVGLLKLEANKNGVTKIFTFGEGDHNDAKLISIITASNGVRATASILGDEVTFQLRDAGQHQAVNALAVLLSVKLLGGDLSKAITALQSIEPFAGRGKREQLDIGDATNPVTLIDESYNASPVSMKAAFKVLALIDPGRGGRRIAILGDMLELGADSARLHADLALPLRAANVDLVYTCGKNMRHLHENLPHDTQKVHKDTSAELAEIVPDVLVPGDVVMVKGSLGSKMGTVIEALRALPARKKSANDMKR